MRHKDYQRKGITLIELLVAIVLIAIGAGAVSAVLSSGNYLLRRSRNEARATSIALAHKESLLAHSYENVLLGIEQGNEDIFHWETEVQELFWAGTSKNIPYKQIDVTVTYPDEGASGNIANKWKKLTLRNLIPYPFVHLERRVMDSSCATSSCTVPPSSFQLVGDLTITFNYPVVKDLNVFYNIAVNITNPAGLAGTENIVTKCFLDGAQQGQKTGTPILSQPLISNNTVIPNVAAGAHTLQVRWYKDTTSGVISITRANLMMLAFETQN
ncbi:MAG: prepilin-type N-terminal cleavage/methylation domain-containing protein [Candidatus Omnitrophica bacterium]|nr:prepilin-type N-terminal cleavage/methylation domain-containing protein [Candidatus Omnitrophota bacterium]MBU2044687.1 prepilin-type N-terminal cleavage/methylation domain-containing protein [Candidatus Omnitrophota bacterium]MBU2265423.1 prepilin-type N-terminal cleavage/methylation domain-containing protein [Candidatus Omnitrophota bacterium]MBU2474249.1 prepilin-type N-terminal cleavage/methylation domain-containing protein [Candidatus Omnitrophota bacterium]